MPRQDLEATFNELRSILERYQESLAPVHDESGYYYLDTHHLLPNKKPLFFGAVRVAKQHVSYHLMPVYLWPELLNDLSEVLRKSMQGKSCFNLKTCEGGVKEELSALTQRGFDRYRAEGYIG